MKSFKLIYLLLFRLHLILSTTVFPSFLFLKFPLFRPFSSLSIFLTLFLYLFSFRSSSFLTSFSINFTSFYSLMHYVFFPVILLHIVTYKPVHGLRQLIRLQHNYRRWKTVTKQTNLKRPLLGKKSRLQQQRIGERCRLVFRADRL
jgi:hypothetical protein